MCLESRSKTAHKDQKYIHVTTPPAICHGFVMFLSFILIDLPNGGIIVKLVAIIKFTSQRLSSPELGWGCTRTTIMGRLIKKRFRCGLSICQRMLL
jgi:hypothetical protein